MSDKVISPPDEGADGDTLLIEQIDRLLDGGLHEAEAGVLEQRLDTDAAARRLFAERLHVHGALKSEFASSNESSSAVDNGNFDIGESQESTADDAGFYGQRVETASVVEQQPTEVSRRRQVSAVRKAMSLPGAVLIASIGSIAVGLIAGLFAGTANQQASPQPVARLVSSENCRWNSSSLPTAAGADLPAGSLALIDGVARLQFRSGATIDLEGPARIELISPMKCRLEEGALVATVPESAKGFVVETASGRVIDYGTQFGLSVRGDAADVQVFDGLVEVESTRQNTRTAVAAGNGARFARAGAVATFPLDSESESGTASDDPALPSSEVTISSGRGLGATEYIFSPGTVDHHSSTLMLSKSAAGKTYRRKPYVRFDLGDVSGDEIASATLTLSFAPTGYGYASRSPNAEFTVYGLTDETRDDWDADAVDWQNAPANLAEGNALDSKLVRPVGKFTISSNETAGVRELRSPELVEFLQSDTNGLVTLIIVRDTLATADDPGSIVHGFAGNRHPTIAPPSLRIDSGG
ncbi:DNRLRE domain-containing protein [Stratiformator vulcanicus]|uniref:FecR protein n=1 Tax=Stratiformator vulcanicus TaxID=2527980 RepID=A0A517QY99_9PLAN|nr:DNRLRE domain-containing protein [Stratiformator vulcanicus]QDT36611.1 FecR protein [Stratiformator vulcanicus]